jgi:hypothetical protein
MFYRILSAVGESRGGTSLRPAEGWTPASRHIVSNTFRGHHFCSSEGTGLFVVSFSQAVPGRVAWTPGGSALCWGASYSHEG